MNHKLKLVFRELVERFPLLKPLYVSISHRKTKSLVKLDDMTFFTQRFKENMGQSPNLDNPTTYNEKLIWLQMHDHNPLYTTLSDKYLVKKWVSDRIGEKHVVPAYGVWDSVDSIPFSKLPDECVLKCNHDCGSIYIKRKDKPFAVETIKKTFSRALKQNYYDVGRVWGYKDIKPLVFCEQYIHSLDGDVPRDYKIFCFEGEPKFAFVASDRGIATKFDFFDLNWNKIPVKQHYPNSNYQIPRPKQWDEMLEIARKLSEGIPQVRVDLYINSDDVVMFGEMTFCHFSGKEPFEPAEYDRLFGSYCDIEKAKASPYFE